MITLSWGATPLPAAAQVIISAVARCGGSSALLGWLHQPPPYNPSSGGQLTARGVSFITRAKQNMAYRTERVVQATSQRHDLLVWVGSAGTACQHLLRLGEVEHAGRWYRYLTNVLDPQVLPAEDVVALYGQRWRIEEAFHIGKRLLGLAYFWTGSQNGVALQLWATWLLYAVLIDLTDAVAERLKQPFGALSVEMVYRGVYHFSQAFRRGEAQDPVAFLAEHARLLGIIKRPRKRTPPTTPLLTAASGA